MSIALAPGVGIATNTFVLMGTCVGHRIYKAWDPRALICKELVRELVENEEERVSDEVRTLFEVAIALEEAALADEYFQKRKLYPNVDYYSGLFLAALGIPENMFTVCCAVARTTGWISQWKEMIEDPIQKIGRPRQLYQGATLREVPPVDARGNGEDAVLRTPPTPGSVEPPERPPQVRV